MGFPILDGPAGWWKAERAPLRHMMTERRSELLAVPKGTWNLVYSRKGFCACDSHQIDTKT